MTGNYTALQFWFNVMQALATLALFLYTRRMGKQKASEDRIRSIEKALSEKQSASNCEKHGLRMSAIETRVSEINIELDHLPTQRQISELNQGINNLSGELRVTQGRLEGINRAVDLMNEFLINQGKQK